MMTTLPHIHSLSHESSNVNFLLLLAILSTFKFVSCYMFCGRVLTGSLNFMTRTIVRFKMSIFRYFATVLLLQFQNLMIHLENIPSFYLSVLFMSMFVNVFYYTIGSLDCHMATVVDMCERMPLPYSVTQDVVLYISVCSILSAIAKAVSYILLIFVALFSMFLRCVVHNNFSLLLLCNM